MLKAFVAGFALLLSATLAQAMNIQEVTSPRGIKAWLVEDKAIPLIAMNFSFDSGSTADEPGKEGTVHFITGMMDEGAADLDSAAFQAKRDELAVKLAFDDGADQFEGNFQTLSKNSDAGFTLLKKALTAPHFAPDAMERVRQQFLVSASQELEDPEKIASTAWMNLAFPGHAYARQGHGTPATLATITPDDLHAMHKKIFTRSGLKIAVVGDIDAARLAKVLDDVFGDLPDTPPPPHPAKVDVAKKATVQVIDRDIPQSIIVFGSQGILRDDPEFIPAYVMTHILGGGAFSSRLSDEVREKRGLTYGISLGLAPFESAGIVIGSLSTRNEKAGEAMAVIRETMARMAKEGPTQAELGDAKTYLTGNYALRFDSNAKIASQLLGLLQNGFGINYVNERNAKIAAVTLEQVKAQAQRLIDVDHLLVTVVGRPEGLKSTASGG
jgi:zinc protease